MTPPCPSMRIWHVNLAAGLGAVDGILSACVRLAAAQAHAGHDVRLFLVDSHAGEVVRSGLGTDAVLEAAPTTAVALARATSLLADPATRPDIVHLHSVYRPAHARLAHQLARAGVPYVTAPHSGLSRASRRRYPARKAVYGAVVERRLLVGAAGVACLTATEEADTRAYCRRPDLPTWVVPNGLDSGTFATAPWAPVGSTGVRPRAITLARFDVRQKGLDILASIARRCPEVDFVVHGQADHNQPRRTARLLATAPTNLTFLPPVHGPEKYAALAGSTIFLQPSRWEGFSVALAEAMAVGVPCGVSRYVADSLGVAERGLGLVLDPDVDVAARQVRAAVADPDRLRSWSTAARAYARAELGDLTVARRHVEHYRRVVRRPDLADAD